MKIFSEKEMRRIAKMLYSVEERLKTALPCNGDEYCGAGAFCENDNIRFTLSHAIDEFEGRKSPGIVE